MNWRRDYTSRVIEEYRRFLYLCCTTGREMTPSRDVDEAWHLHLIYTRSYWDELCGKTLRRPLHHNPTSGGTANAVRFREAYAATLAAYERAFDEKPPADIWPDVEKRFAPLPSELEVWRVPKTPLKRVAAWTYDFILALLILLSASGEALSAAATRKWDPLALVIVILLAALAIHRVSTGKNDGRDGGGCGSGSGGDGGCGGGCGGCGG
jgi:hypothetical protein